MTSTRRRLFAFAQIGFGLMVLLGSAAEAVNLLVPSLVPEIQKNSLMVMHHQNRVIFWWTLLSNLVTIPIALSLIVSGAGIARGRVESSRLALRASALFALIVAGAAIVNGVYLIPPLLTKLDGAMRTMVLISIGSALTGVSVALLVIAWGNRVIVRRG